MIVITHHGYHERQLQKVRSVMQTDHILDRDDNVIVLIAGIMLRCCKREGQKGGYTGSDEREEDVAIDYRRGRRQARKPKENNEGKKGVQWGGCVHGQKERQLAKSIALMVIDIQRTKKRISNESENPSCPQGRRG